MSFLVPNFLNNQSIRLKGFKGGSRHRDCFMARALGFLIRYFSNYYTLHRSDLAARAAPLDPRLSLLEICNAQKMSFSIIPRRTKYLFRYS